MLYLGDGIREVEVGEDLAMQILPDFSDPAQFYYLPHFPRIAETPAGTPAIRLLVYREDLEEIDDDDEEAVAFLSLDVDLRWDPDLVEEARGKLRVQDNLAEDPRLVPIFYREGSVRMLLLDAASPEEGEEEDELEPTRFVTAIEGAASPSLYGDNRAIFQATLPKRGAAAISGALDGLTPIGIVYSLTFAGLQPAFHVRASVDWERVHEHFSERENLNLLFYERDVQKQIDELIDERAITIDMTIEGVGAEAMDSDREEAMKQVRQLIFEKFFEATFERETAAGAGTGAQVADVIRTIGQDGLTWGVGYTYSRKEVTISELRSLDLDWTARRATERTIYPQAHMHNVLADSGLTLDDLVTVVDGADGVWKTLPIEVVATAAWEADGIAGISVELEYTDADSGVVRSTSEFLDEEHPSFVHRDWMDRTGGNRLRYKYEVVFSDEGVPGPSPKISSATDDAEWIDYEGTTVTIHPRELYDSVELEVGAVPGFPFDRWPAVLAAVRYRSGDDSFHHFHDGLITSQTPKVTTRFRTDRGAPGIREARLSYIGATGERVDTAWQPMEQDQLVVVDPHADKLEVRAIVAGDRKNIANLLVDLLYEDEENGVFESKNLSFTPTNINEPQLWTVQLADRAKRRYFYRMTLITSDTGEFLQTGWISTDAPSLPVGEVYVRTLAVEVLLGELDDDFEAVEVELVYDDPDNELHREEAFRMTSGSRHEWSLLLKDASRRSYDVTTTWIAHSGFNRKVGPVSRSDTLLVVPGRPEGD